MMGKGCLLLLYSQSRLCRDCALVIVIICNFVKNAEATGSNLKPETNPSYDHAVVAAKDMQKVLESVRGDEYYETIFTDLFGDRFKTEDSLHALQQQLKYIKTLPEEEISQMKKAATGIVSEKLAAMQPELKNSLRGGNLTKEKARALVVDNPKIFLRLYRPIGHRHEWSPTHFRTRTPNGIVTITDLSSALPPIGDALDRSEQ